MTRYACLLGTLCASLWLVLASGPAGAQLYKWTDERGQTHITDDLSRVPEQYRPKAPPPEPPKPAEPARPPEPPARASEPGDSRRSLYGPPVAPAERPAAERAIEALRALQAAARAGLPYADYTRRVRETKAVVDRSLARLGPTHTRAKIREAMGHYTAAASVWGARLTDQHPARPALRHALDALRVDCPQVATVLDRGDVRVIEQRSVEIVWACAAERLGEAEERLAAR